ncbi:ATP12 chaperone protein [Saccharibacter sp. 17.LH.SD]|uniref:ATP12 family protein n=1 Tax=Saccharibacter sp. 17.LH.SD TaxID=2689393 RepID=UPI00136ECFC5|nr:ATP12 family protein [Saccharibacter sp. 17.LH.SD]MXV43965.1 ATP12 chaperone protein [Saccharibacter sp. 17.LH.SD]
MSTPRKRFWKQVDVQAMGEGMYAPVLDGRSIKLPQGAALSVSSRALAEAIAEEWRSVKMGDALTPDALSLTRITGSFIERVEKDVSTTKDVLLSYGMDDALSYRSAAQDEVLLGRVLSWLQTKGLSPEATFGIMPLQQPMAYQVALEQFLDTLEADTLAALGVIVPIFSSLLLALALIHNVVTVDEAMRLGNADEEKQLQQWGHDDELAHQLQQKERDVRDALRFLELSRQSGR